ncbi:MAG: ATP-dependent nuclease [Coriobacteriia bacterium]
MSHIETYVRTADLQTASPENFRNRVAGSGAARFRRFKDLAEATWPALEIRPIEPDVTTLPRGYMSLDDTRLSLYVRDHEFEGEAAWMGQGLQMWLQIIWFLAGCRTDDFVVLDEPDIFMHPDLQHRLMDVLLAHDHQTAVTTHSVEMMADVEPESLLVLNKSEKESGYADRVPGTDLLKAIGTVHNLQLARIASSGICLMVEGSDLKLLRRLHATLFPDAKVRLDRVPSWPIGGSGGLKYAAAWAAEFRRHQPIHIYCLLDSDYHPQEVLDEQQRLAKSSGIDLHVWERKEVEGYLLEPGAIVRTIASDRLARRVPSVMETRAALMTLSDEMYEQTRDDVATQYQQRTRAVFKSAREYADGLLGVEWDDLKGRLRWVSSKRLLGRISSWAQQECGVSLSASSLARNIHIEEIPAEMTAVLGAITRGQRIAME